MKRMACKHTIKIWCLLIHHVSVFQTLLKMLKCGVHVLPYSFVALYICSGVLPGTVSERTLVFVIFLKSLARLKFMSCLYFGYHCSADLLSLAFDFPAWSSILSMTLYLTLHKSLNLLQFLLQKKKDGNHLQSSYSPKFS